MFLILFFCTCTIVTIPGFEIDLIGAVGLGGKSVKLHTNKVPSTVESDPRDADAPGQAHRGKDINPCRES
jgi:hypothetical protein